MKTDDLIRGLAIDARVRAPSVAMRLASALPLGFTVSLILFALMLGPRPDALESAMSNPFFDLKFVIVLALALAAMLAGHVLTRPEAARGGRMWLLLLPLALLAAGIVADFIVPQDEGWRARMIGDNAQICLTAIPLLSLPILGAALWALRHGATSHPLWLGALAGLIASGLAAALYAAHCTDDSPLFVAVWYSAAIALVTIIGALIGPRVLRY